GVEDLAAGDEVERGAGLNRDGVGVVDGLGAQRVEAGGDENLAVVVERAVLDGGAALEVEHAADGVEVGRRVGVVGLGDDDALVDGAGGDVEDAAFGD